MSRKQSYDAGLSSSVRLNYTDKLCDDLYTSKKYHTYFDKFSTPAFLKDNSQEVNFTTTSTQFTAVRKLPDNVSNIRETFSFNTAVSSKSETESNMDNQHRSKNSRLNDLLNQALDLKAIKRKEYPKSQQIIQSTSFTSNIDNPYPKSQTQISEKSHSTIDEFKQTKIGNSFEFKTFLGTGNKDNRPEKSYSASVQEQIRKLRQQNYQKKSFSNKQVDNQETSSPYLKNYSVISDPKESFSKKNYIEYYSPKIEKSTTSKLSYDFNTLSPPFERRKKQASFQVKRQSPKFSLQASTIKNLLDIPSIKISLEVPSPKIPLQKKTSSRSNTKRLLTDKVKIEDFEIGKKLGQGRFGTAYLAFHKATGSVFAIKMVKKEMIKQNKLVEQFILEVKLQSFLDHPFILKIYGIFDDEETIYLVMEYLPQGTLFNYFKNAKSKKLSEQDAAEKVRYLAESIKYLQDRGIAHRDIKPQNIIMSNNVCKLADFGWATFCDQERRKTYCGTCDYVAPQILQGEEYDQSVDLWCIGVLAYELIAGKAPFYHMSQKETRNKIMNVSLVYPQEFSENLKSFLGGLIQKNPEERMSIEEVLEHPFIKDVKLVQLN